MATIVLQSVGAAVGSLVGGPIGGALGGVLGASLGGLVPGAAEGGGSGRTRFRSGPRLSDLNGIASSEGAPIPRVYGRMRVGGQVIWATSLVEEATRSVSRPRGGKGGQGRRAPATVETSYAYHANVAIGLCEGEIAFVRRVWADGKLLDLSGVTMRVHTGGEAQAPDPLIVAKQGAGAAPAYRGLAYVVFERLPLASFGNRLPQLSFEVVRPVHGLCAKVRAINLIPGAGEYVYEPAAVAVSAGLGVSRLPNRAQLTHATDWHASLDALQALCPNLKHVALVATWFGTDLRAAHCQIVPKAEPGSIDGHPYSWSVAGLTRAAAVPMSAVDGAPAFGGTPTDGSVVRAIRDLKARGLSVTLYPFVMMDVPAGNALPDPATGAASQPAYPWRGRITVDPAPGRQGSAEGAAAEAQVAALFGTAAAAHFTLAGDNVAYAGPQEWSYRRFALHMAALAKAAGGVESFVIGSELIGLTRARGAGAVNPAVAALIQVAAEARALLGPAVKLIYGADWTEYGAESRAGGQDVRFPLDPLFADANIAAVAIDWYPPFSDWRDGTAHADALLFDGPHDPALFAAGVAGGEAFDWHYADDAGRLAQDRRPIADGAYGKPWIYRAKDLVAWWSNAHHPRAGGVESATPTAWQPGMKPIWLLEAGCPAVDRGGNGPNVFPDPKSSESRLPPFSRGNRDDLVQARLLAALIDHFAGAPSARNPVATLYAGRMLDPERIYLWAWDARPFPAFPAHRDRWADGGNHETGHWLTGRLEGAPLDDLIRAVLADMGAPQPSTLAVDGFIDGMALDRPMSARAALDPLASAFGFDARPEGAALAFRRRRGLRATPLAEDDLAVSPAGDRPILTRAQASEQPAALSLAFIESEWDYRQAMARAELHDAASRREAAVEFAAALPRATAQHLAETMLAETRAARDTIRFELPLSRLDILPGDGIVHAGRRYLVQRIADGATRRVEAVGLSATTGLAAPSRAPRPEVASPRLAGRPLAVVLDLPAADSSDPALQHLAVAADPWPGAFTLWRSDDGGAGFEPVERVATAAVVGETLGVFPAGPLWRFDRWSTLDIRLSGGALRSVSEMGALANEMTLAIEAPGGGWEIVSFADAALIGVRCWRLSRFIRGLAGSEAHAGVAKPAGSRVVMLDGALVPLARGVERLGLPSLHRLSAEGSDHADPLAVAFAATPGPAALRPLAPVHVKARRSAAGVAISFTRRARFGGDGWELAEAPLHEEREAYEVEIRAGPDIKRVLAGDRPEILYAAAAEIADFGSPRTSLELAIRQLSAAVGPGQPAVVTTPVL
jgi:hypothetical protein